MWLSLVARFLNWATFQYYSQNVFTVPGVKRYRPVEEDTGLSISACQFKCKSGPLVVITIIKYIYIAQVRRRKRRKCTRVHSCMSNGKVFSLFLNVFIAMSGFRSVCFVRYLAYLATIKYTYIHT